MLYLIIRMDLQEVGCGYVDWIGLAQDRDRCYTCLLGWICRRWDVGMWTGLGWPRIGTGVILDY